MSRHTGFAHLPLHPGQAPAWLFTRMTRLAREISSHIIADRGPDELLRRLSDPFWFQAFGCVLGFDWHSSGVTTTVTGALKEGLRTIEHELGVFALGGKGATSRRTPTEILDRCERLAVDPARFLYASRTTAKIDNTAVQDGYQLYHHAFFFSTSGQWCVVQQGMHDRARTARRYHWLSEALPSYIDEPHAAICSDARGDTLNLVSHEHAAVRARVVELTRTPDTVMNVVQRYVHGMPRLPFEREEQKKPGVDSSGQSKPAFVSPPTLDMPRRHALLLQDVDPRHLKGVLLATYDRAPEHFEALLGLEGVGARTLRALALVSEVIYGTPTSMRDPARFAFAHGGKDGTPFPVDRATYDRTIDVLHRAMARAHVDRSEKVDALKRLSRFARATEPRTTESGDTEHTERRRGPG